MSLAYLLFFFVSILYASAGFGGGSLYIAILAFSPISYHWIPIIALLCNITVVSGNCFHHAKHHSISFFQLMPFVGLSIPAAFLGGKMVIHQSTLFFLLGLTLLFSSFFMLIQPKKITLKAPPLNFFSLILGGSIGFLSGLIGIGGGIFLSPILHLMRSWSSRQIAAISSLYILVNSLSGLAGQLFKINDPISFNEFLWLLLPFMVVVALGGTIGNQLSFKWMNELKLKRVTAVIIFIAACKLLLGNC